MFSHTRQKKPDRLAWDLTQTFVRLDAIGSGSGGMSYLFLCELVIPGVCTESNGDRVNFLCSSTYSAVVWICDNTSFKVAFACAPSSFPESAHYGAVSHGCPTCVRASFFHNISEEIGEHINSFVVNFL